MRVRCARRERGREEQSDSDPSVTPPACQREPAAARLQLGSEQRAARRDAPGGAARLAEETAIPAICGMHPTLSEWFGGRVLR